jgi:hypothetical protein
MTAKADIVAVQAAITPTARAASIKSGVNVDALMVQLRLKAEELSVLVNQVIKLHPTGDANLTALNNIIAELA